MSNRACHATPKLSYGGLKLPANGDHSSFEISPSSHSPYEKYEKIPTTKEEKI